MVATMEKPKTINNVHTDIKRGEIWMVNLGEGLGSEQKFKRPCVITQNNRGNFYSSTTVIVPLTTKTKTKMHTHVQLYAEKTNLNYDSVALAEQQRAISKERLLFKVGQVDIEAMRQIGLAIMISNELEEYIVYN